MAFQPGGQIAFIMEIQQGLGQRAQSVTIEPANPAALGFRDLPDRTSKLAQDQRQLTRFPAFFPSLLLSFFPHRVQVRVAAPLQQVTQGALAGRIGVVQGLYRHRVGENPRRLQLLSGVVVNF